MLKVKTFLGITGALFFGIPSMAQTYVRNAEPLITPLVTVESIDDSARARLIRADDVSPEEYARLLAEAEKIRTYQNNVNPLYGVYDGRPNANNNISSTITSRDTNSAGYQIELYQQPISAPNVSMAPMQPIAVPAIKTDRSISETIVMGQHKVVSGDTLYNIARRYDVALSDLKAANDLTNNIIGLGQMINVPIKRRAIAQSYTTTDPTLVRNVEPIPFNGIYAVLPGDTLYSISRQACVTVSDIQAANNMGNSSVIQLGQKLSLPHNNCLR